jgi:hypothetical protein
VGGFVNMPWPRLAGDAGRWSPAVEPVFKTQQTVLTDMDVTDVVMLIT